MPDKPRRELYLLERFLPALFGDEPYLLSQPSPPLPDFIIEIGGRKIGIEETEIIPDEKIMERESIQANILKGAQRIFENQRQLPLHVRVTFAEADNWKNLERNKVAALLAEAVRCCVEEAKVMPQNQQYFDVSIEKFIHSHIQSVGVFYLSQLTDSCWSPRGSIWVPSVPVEKIRTIIDDKSKNLSGYLTGCDEVWLLMLETGSLPSCFDHFEKLQDVKFASGFARILIGRIIGGNLVELQTNSIK